MPATPPDPSERRARGFRRAGALVTPQLEAAARRRGFTEARLLADWEAIAGADIAASVRPLRMSRGRAGAGGTLTVLAEGARAAEIQMMLPVLKGRINAALGWPAVAQIRMTQASRGFSEQTSDYRGKPSAQTSPPDPARLDPALAEVSNIVDGGLRRALETMARNVLSDQVTGKGSEPR